MFSYYFLNIIYLLYLIKSQYPIDDLDLYDSNITLIQSDYIISKDINNEKIIFANNSQYSFSKDGNIEYIQEFQNINKYSTFYYDSENNIFYYVCTDDYLVIGSNNDYYEYNNENIEKKPTEKCSITKMNDSDSDFYFIISGTKEINTILSLYFIKLNKNLELEKYFVYITTENSLSSIENEFSTCLSLYQNTLILCVYRNNVLIGGVINSYFTDFISNDYIHGEYNKLINFFFFLFNDETTILISRNNGTNNYFITTIKIRISDYNLQKKNITSFISDLDLNNIGVAIYDKGLYIGTINKEYIYIYNINFETNMKYTIKIAINDTINQISLTYFNDGYLGILFNQLTDPIDNYYNISYSIILYPEPINCNPKSFVAFSNEEINIDISNIFPKYSNAYFENNFFNFTIIDSNLTGITLNHGSYKFQITYLYNQSNTIYYIDEKCYIIYQICNEACDYCDIYSNDSNNTLCVNCTKSYAPLINDSSQCVKNNKTLSLYYYSSIDDTFHFCYELCLYCNQEGNLLDNNCEVCINESYRVSYMKKGQCIFCDIDNNNLFYYSNENRIICLDDSIIKCPENYPYLIKDNNECTSSCPSSFPLLLNNECLNECPIEKGYIEFNSKCICHSNYLYYYDIDNNLICLLDNKCPNKYPNLNTLTGECKKNEKDIIFNNETIDECPINTKQIDKGNYYTCSCINPYYIINEKIYCSSTSLCNTNKNEYILLIKEENLCVKECNTNYPIKFEDYCLNKCPMGYTIYNNKCIIISGFNTTENIEIEIYETFTIMKGETFIAQTYDTSIESTTNANLYGNLSTIDFGECINILKNKNNIPTDENLIIIKIDIYREDSVTNQVEYLILTQDGIKLDLSVCSGINIQIENLVKISPEELDLEKALEVYEYGYDMYNSKDSFYNSICTVFTNGNGTDVPLENRKSDYFKNISFCENGCEYNSFNLSTLRVKCSCEIKTTISTNENDFSFQSLSSEFTSIISNSNIKVFICFKSTFSKYLISNYAFWIILICVIIEIICMIMYCLKRFDPIFLKIKNAKEFYGLEKMFIKDGMINEYIQDKENFFQNNDNKIINDISKNDNSKNKIINSPLNPPKNKQSEKVISKLVLTDKSNNECLDKNLDTPKSKKISNSPSERKHIHHDKNLKHYLEEKFSGNKEFNTLNLKNSNRKLKLVNQNNNKKKKRKKIHFYEKDKPGTDLNGNEIKIYSSRLKIMKTNNFDKESYNSIKTNKESIGDELIIYPHTDEQLNRLDYYQSLNYDKRKILSIYIGFIKYSQLIIFTFITNSDYNLKYIKVCLFIFSFIGFFFFNTLFFSDKTMTKIYKSKGKYQFIYSLPKTIFSSICCILINTLLKFISLSNRQIIRLTKEKNPKKEEKILFEIIKKLKIKLIIFFILLFFFSLIVWYYVTAFCSVYINTQKHLITNTMLSFGESMLYPFGICLITTILRKISLKYKSRIIFIISKIFQRL